MHQQLRNTPSEEVVDRRNPASRGFGGDIGCRIDAKDAEAAPLERAQQGAIVAANFDNQVATAQARRGGQGFGKLVAVVDPGCRRRWHVTVAGKHAFRPDGMGQLHQMTRRTELDTKRKSLVRRARQLVYQIIGERLRSEFEHRGQTGAPACHARRHGVAI